MYTNKKQELYEEKESLKELVSDISHQTKTPLANIKLYQEMLSDEINTAESTEHLTKMNKQVGKLDFLLQSMVKMSRLETGTISREEIFTKISITDTGKGIPLERQGTIFNRFYREPEVHNTEGVGIGLVGLTYLDLSRLQNSRLYENAVYGSYISIDMFHSACNDNMYSDSNSYLKKYWKIVLLLNDYVNMSKLF